MRQLLLFDANEFLHSFHVLDGLSQVSLYHYYSDKEAKTGVLGPYSPNNSQEYSLSFSPRFTNLNVTQLLIG